MRCRPRAGVLHHHVAAHAVAEQIDRLAIWRVVVDQRVQIAQVVGEHVVVQGASVVWPKPRQSGAMRGADRQSRRWRVHHELVGRAHVHPAVHQHQRHAAGRVGWPQQLTWTFSWRSDNCSLRAGVGDIAHAAAIIANAAWPLAWG